MVYKKRSQKEEGYLVDKKIDNRISPLKYRYQTEY
jgi:hypothetical protein